MDTIDNLSWFSGQHHFSIRSGCHRVDPFEVDDPYGVHFSETTAPERTKAELLCDAMRAKAHIRSVSYGDEGEKWRKKWVQTRCS
jgi:hypothetical protein